jgi:transcriptional regulator NrdR family protein
MNQTEDAIETIKCPHCQSANLRQLNVFEQLTDDTVRRKTECEDCGQACWAMLKLSHVEKEGK